MSYKEIIRIFEQRRDKMKTLLAENPNSMGLPKQHQVFGAITEIEVFLQTLRDYCDKQNHDSASKPLDFYTNTEQKK